MKRYSILLLILALTLCISGCAKTNIDPQAEVTLHFVYGDKDIHAVLQQDEAESILAILDGNPYDPAFAGVPSCGFHENISLQVGEQVFAIACDSCSYIQDTGNQKYFSISDEDMEYIRNLFSHYGGHFPCV